MTGQRWEIDDLARELTALLDGRAARPGSKMIATLIAASVFTRRAALAPGLAATMFAAFCTRGKPAPNENQSPEFAVQPRSQAIADSVRSLLDASDAPAHVKALMAIMVATEYARISDLSSPAVRMLARQFVNGATNRAGTGPDVPAGAVTPLPQETGDSGMEAP